MLTRSNFGRDTTGRISAETDNRESKLLLRFVCFSATDHRGCYPGSYHRSDAALIELPSSDVVDNSLLTHRGFSSVVDEFVVDSALRTCLTKLGMASYGSSFSSYSKTT